MRSGVFIESKLLLPGSIGVVVQRDVNKGAIFGAVIIWILFLMHLLLPGESARGLWLLLVRV